MASPYEITRIAIIISKRVSNKAVDRNLLRRRLQSIIQRRLSRISQPYDIVMIAQPTALSANYRELELAVSTVLSKQRVV